MNELPEQPGTSHSTHVSIVGVQGTNWGQVTQHIYQAAPLPRPVTWPVRFLPTHLPVGYVERLTALAELRAALLQPHPLVGVVAATAVHGEGGLGKTVLARAICDDDAVKQRYPDGVLWATLGQTTDPARHQREWIYELGGDVAAARSLESGKIELQRLLADRAVLLVLDDVWDANDVSYLHIDAPRCGLLLTTRDAAHADGASLVRLAVLERTESRALLRAVAPGTTFDDALADQIADRLGHLPLALQVVSRLLASGMTWTDITEALAAHDLAFLAHGQHSVLAAIQTSVTALPANQAALYQELVIFPRAQPLHPATVARLWRQSAGLQPYQVRGLLARFRQRALIQANDLLHDLHVDYLHAMVAPAEIQRLHSHLVDAYGDVSTWGALPDEDEYYGWRYLAAHLAQAGRLADLRTLLTNGSYLQGKIARLRTAVLLDDFTLLLDDTELLRLAGAIRLGAHVLDHVPEELGNQLRGRLGNHIALDSLPTAACAGFILESLTLAPPDGNLLRTFAGHTDGVLSCAFSPDGRLVSIVARECTTTVETA